MSYPYLLVWGEFEAIQLFKLMRIGSMILVKF